jgi:pantoate--beta-alanine ligase
MGMRGEHYSKPPLRICWAKPMQIERTTVSIRDALAPHRGGGASIGLVPTMGAFHAGHVALFDAARRECDVVVVSVFVNPAQFGDPADLVAYPRDLDRDAAMARASGVDYLFAPGETDIYATGHATWVEVGGAADGFEGQFRPGHFRGVATICLKLFNIVAPRHAYFGQKDAQQVAVIQQVVRDLNVDVHIKVVPTVRDADGLALSSRNARLSAEERQKARAIPQALSAGAAAFREGADPVAAAERELQGLDTEYVAVATLNGLRALVVAARVGRTRLIDNLPLDDAASSGQSL